MLTMRSWGCKRAGGRDEAGGPRKGDTATLRGRAPSRKLGGFGGYGGFGGLCGPVGPSGLVGPHGHGAARRLPPPGRGVIA